MTHRGKPSFLLVILLLAVAAPAAAGGGRPRPIEREVNLAEFFTGIDADDATFVVVDPSSGTITRHNPARAKQRFVPASTFKIPNSLIALETGVVSGPGHVIRWNGKRGAGFWADAWSRDHTLRSAMRNSVYWYYQSVARGIGAARMQHYLDRFDYGNRDLGGGIDAFWLHGDLRISADEQVRFLERMYRGELGVSERTTAVVKDILLLDAGAGYRLSGKTGTADVTASRELAWLVGYVERGDDVWFYALNMEGEEVWERWGSPAARIALVRALLARTGVIAKE